MVGRLTTEEQALLFVDGWIAIAWTGESMIGRLFSATLVGSYYATLLGPSAGAQPQRTARLDVQTTPFLVLGASSTDSMAMFVGVYSAIKTTTGYAVADARSPAVLIFDELGKLVRRIGRSGKGPGEFVAATWVGQCAGDSLFVWDNQEFRFSVFDRSGTFVRQFRAPVPGARAACSSQGTIGLLMFPKRGSPPDPSGTAPIDSVSIRLLSTRGDSVGTIPNVPFGDGRFFGRITALAMRRQEIVVGTAEGPHVDVYDRTGRRLRRLTLPISPRETSGDAHARAVEYILAGVRGERREQQRRALMSMPIPKFHASYRDLSVTENGIVWLTTTSPADGDTVTVLKAVGPDGRIVGEATLKRAMRLFEAGADFLIMSYESDSGPIVSVFRVRSKS